MKTLLTLIMPILLLPLPAQAQSVIPYSGYLEADGEVGAGAVQMRFVLYSDRNGGDEAELWRSWPDDETWHTLALSHGRFSVNLGGNGQSPLVDDMVFTAAQHFLKILIKANNRTHTLDLQELHSVPKAVLAERAISFKVTQDLTVTGTTTTQDLTVTGKTILGSNPQDKPATDYNEELVVTRRDGAGRDPFMLRVGHYPGSNAGVIFDVLQNGEFGWTAKLGDLANVNDWRRVLWYYFGTNTLRTMADVRIEGPLRASLLTETDLDARDCRDIFLGCSGHDCGNNVYRQTCPDGYYMKGFQYQAHHQWGGYGHTIICCRP